MDRDILQAVAEHIALPPVLPQEAPKDEVHQSVEAAICQLAATSSVTFATEEPAASSLWERLTAAIRKLADMVGSPLLIKDAVLQQLESMSTSDIAVFHIRRQNAAVIVRRYMEHTTFEVFEVQTPTDTVMQSSGKLLRTFPESAVRVPNSTIDQHGFLDQVSDLFVTMDHTFFNDAIPKTRKAGVDHDEIRDAVHPMYISEMFMAILLAHGSPEQVRTVDKRIADDVLWKNALAPWRRSPVWLILRVLLQTTLDNTSYKAFMIHLHTMLLKQCTEGDLDSELLYVIRAKMARRTHKLAAETDVFKFIVERALAAACQTERLLQSRWQEVQLEDAMVNSMEWLPATLDVEADTIQTLPSCGQHIRDLLRQAPSENSSEVFVPRSIPRIQSHLFDAYAEGQLNKAASVKNWEHIALFDFEQSVRQYLVPWVTQQNTEHSREAACVVLEACMTQYSKAALHVYAHDPAELSNLILTVVELWVAMDQLAISELPLLAEFSPEIPGNFLQPLLLRTRSNLDCASRIESYLARRHARAGSASVFSDVTDNSSFAMRYFASSPTLQALERDIEMNAQNDRNRKIAELQDKNAQYRRLVSQAAAKSHEYRSWNRWTETHEHSPYMCDKCELESEAEDVAKTGIEVHEWPLPANSAQAHRVVFELKAPHVLQLWRSATYAVISGLGIPGRQASEQSPELHLQDYDALRRYHDLLTTNRVSISSTTKPFIRAHYHRQNIPSTQAQVCVPNGCRYQLYDRPSSTWATTESLHPSASSYGTLRLSNKSYYAYLQYAVNSTAHTTNQVIADRSDCPKELALSEHDSFGSLRSGGRLQWLNIMRELEDSTLTLRAEEVFLVISQAAWQIGEMETEHNNRIWHEHLEDESFGKQFLATCQRRLDAIRANWLESITLKLLVALVCRFLSATPTHQAPQLRETACSFLRRSRKVAFDWLNAVESAAQASPDDAETRWHDIICEMAVICRMTYDLNQEDIKLVMRDFSDIHIYLIAAIALHDNQPAVLRDASPNLRTLITRDERVAHAVHPYLTAVIASHHWQGFFSAVKARWSDFAPSSDAHLTSCKQWVVVTTLAQGHRRAQVLHINLLNGLLLIDGQPLGRLPRAYTTHPLYLRTFGGQIMNVLPGPGDMKYATATKQTGGYTLYFALNNSNLRIQAHNDTTQLELVPPDSLNGDFPRTLSHDHAHWLDLKAARLEFRPLHDQWRFSSKNWHLHFENSGQPVASRKWNEHQHRLVDFHSTTSRMITSRLTRLEAALDVVIWVDDPDHGNAIQTNINLPRLRLDFVISNGQITSTSFPGMEVDEDQTCGTFVGLRKRLLLRSNNNTANYAGCRRRSIIIPHGSIHVSRTHHHVHVDIVNAEAATVPYSKFDVNHDLGRIAGASSLTDRLLKVYLHAVTSNCSSDPLTGRMGVEQALSDLNSGALLSFIQLNDEEAHLLRQIAALTPIRQYYPPHLRCMQTVEWSDVSPLAQHPVFALLANVLLAHAKNMSNLVPTITKSQAAINSAAREQLLIARSNAQTSWIYAASSFTYPSSVTADLLVRDQEYTCRSTTSGQSEDFQAVHHAVRVVMAKTPNHPFRLAEWLLQQCPADTDMTGPMLDELSLGFNLDWFNPTIAKHWLTMFTLSRDSRGDGSLGHHRLAFSLAALAYRSKDLRCLIPVVAAIACNPSAQGLIPPEWSTYSLSHGFQREQSTVESILKEHQQSVSQSPSGAIRRNTDESPARHYQRQQEHHQDALRTRVPDLASTLLPQSLPIRIPWDGVAAYRSWFKIEKVEEEIATYFTHCAHNSELKRHLALVEQRICGHGSQTITAIQGVTSSMISLVTTNLSRPCRMSEPVLSLHQALSLGAFPDDVHDSNRIPELDLSLFIPPLVDNDDLRAATNMLCNLAEELRNDADDRIRQLYGKELLSSVLALQNSQPAKHESRPLTPEHRQAMRALITNQCISLKSGWVHKMRLLQKICMDDDHTMHELLQASGLTARNNALDFMHLLSLEKRRFLAADRLTLVMDLCQTFVLYQHACRLLSLAHSEMSEILKEYQYWRTTFDDESPDHLLLQIDGDFRIRRQQLDVAREMKLPSLEQNSSAVEQLNMGEGKSSVITPMVVADLADGGRLVRLVVLKSLSGQMHTLLVNRLGGLVNRRVFYLPFCRQLDLGGNNLKMIQGLLQECADVGGVLLAQPEHVLSMKLMAIDRSLTAIHDVDQLPLATDMTKLQSWQDANCRQVMDESDELLHVQYQLVYTFGDQQALDDSPDRWGTIMDILSLTSRHELLSKLDQQFPGCVQYDQRRPGCFPVIRLLHRPEREDEVWNFIVHDLTRAVFNGKLQNISLTHISQPDDIDILTQFFTRQNLSDEALARVKLLCKGSWRAALLVRGLLACSVLRHVLADKRHRVNYGLDIKRSLLAVPYSAKDVPTLRSEFSHPDVCIALTALSYAYTGLNERQLMQCFDILARSDDPESEYQLWIKQNPGIDSRLKKLSGVNTKDLTQFRQIVYPALEDNQATIRFFVTHVVFPKESKEFPYKLSASGWDLAESRSHITTGFSGTNDRKYLLPTSIQQHDLPEQLKTNALVMSYLLQPENRSYFVMPKPSTQHPSSTQAFLHHLSQEHRDVRVLLDVGAQMLDMQNDDLMEHWLFCANPDHDVISAGVYFNERDELVVLTKDGSKELYETSPYKYTMDKVLVYLDDAHTRGTDLKLPRNTKAAVTLGPKITKDRLVQGCMRMRQLGHGQSIVFFAPLESDALIRTAAKGKHHLDSRDILRWAMQETCHQLHHYVPHWAQQGLLHARHQAGEASLRESGDVDSFQRAWKTPEGRTLAEMYGHQDDSIDLLHAAQRDTAMAGRLRMLSVVDMQDPHLDEEQEREISHEVEKEQQLERPPKSKPVQPFVHPDLRQFVRRGCLPPRSQQFPRLMQHLSSEGQAWASTLHGTVEFFRSVKESEDANLTTYARPLHWMITSGSGKYMVVVAVSPFEANELLPDIKQFGKVHVHTYTSRVVQSMLSFSDLKFYTIPALPSHWSPPSAGLQSQYNLFAGQLYFDSYQSYVGLCAFLGLLSPESARLYDQEMIERDGSGFIAPDLRTPTYALEAALADFDQKSCRSNIVESLKEHVSLRRNGIDFFRTHVGQLLHGRQLCPKDIRDDQEAGDEVEYLESVVQNLRI